MAQLSDLSTLTLEKAAEFVALQAELGYSRVVREKRAADAPAPAAAPAAAPGWGNMATGAMIGGGLGAGAGLFSSMSSEEKRKPWLRNMLLGGLLGAGAGGAAGYGYGAMTAKPDQTEAQKVMTELQAAKAKEVAANKLTDPLSGVPTRIYNFFTQRNTQGQDHSPEMQARIAASGANKDETDALKPGVMPPSSVAADYASVPVTGAATTATGYAAGSVIDRMRQGRVTPQTVMGLDKTQIAKLPLKMQPKLTELQGRMMAARDSGGQLIEYPNPLIGHRGTAAGRLKLKTNQPPMHDPLTGKMTVPHTSEIIPKAEWQAYKSQIGSKVMPRPRSGRMLGGFGGAMLATLAARAGNAAMNYFGLGQPSSVGDTPSP